MVDWLHCNICFRQPGPGLNFLLTNCGHIYCEKCVTEGTKEKCKMCKAVCNTIVLSAKMKPDVEVFFTDPTELLKNQSKQLIQILEFQKNHRHRFVTYLKNKVMKQNAFLDSTKKTVLKINELERDISKLKEENHYLKKLISEKGLNLSGRSTPNNRPGFFLSPGYCRVSPMNQSPIQSTSPYSLSNTPGCLKFHSPMSELRGAHHSQSTLSCSMPRVSVRTPPFQGRIGIVAESPCVINPDFKSKFSRHRKDLSHC